MQKEDLYDQLQALQKAQETQLHQLIGMQDDLAKVLEENSELKIENTHLRARLQELEGANGKDDDTQRLSKSRQNLEKLYEQGFHVCTYMYGSRRENNEPCAFCLDVIYGQHQL
ncbi:DNA replication initiation control protein YabA [Agrilactobacillus fermenti]|uniref:DNA replication initiation control protein YabA n=1 Tax=Agrilactobacillus fermenti TaxID=2586909 RepID=UPI001E3F0ECE|nr:DNA replication initiation control protein YabA [Agrilactobacillus fermenti]MCD2255449.1 DNA replication initiation control protein YabA [Agrilactobacillus fermenti]